MKPPAESLSHGLKGQLITLRPATMEDRRPIFEWLTKSDLTSCMMGLPHFPDNPIPTWDQFVNDYVDYFFDGSAPTRGRCFMILVDDLAIGQVNHNDLNVDDHSTELDIWLAGRRHTGKGYGTDALKTLCNHLHKELGCQKFIIAPSRRNLRAVRSYQKAGFAETSAIPPGFIPDYSDTVVMVRSVFTWNAAGLYSKRPPWPDSFI